MPLRATSPRSTRRVPAIAFRSVDLPEPFSPTTATSCPGSTLRSTPRST
ncbi:hypothetical protein SMD44_07477 [Streptomyces alboflavus]|uniref:Uncharacterized protein n=1 Tax=Streptomyces alboflavus TaxID=67267 RepID=A0A1Z1WNG1_9ACTN|nr:hypothetical protein SMD44_07477 [Streptomyces alboflavus]